MSPGIPTRLLATQSDERLLALVRQGHERAFETLVHRYRKPLLGYCRRLPLPDARAEDIVQLALLKTWIAVREGAEVRDLKAWLYRVVHNTAVNTLRDAAHDGEPCADPALGLGSHSPTDESQLDRGLAMREALTEVAALPPLQREVIVRTAMAGHSHEQVASDLGITDGAVRGLLYRARVTLRTAITALTPPPILGWLAGRSDQSGPAPERLTELAGGGAGVGLGGLLLKGSVVAVTTGAVLTGAAVVHLGGPTHHGDPHKLIAAAISASGGGAGGVGLDSAQAHPGAQDRELPDAGRRSHRRARGRRGGSGARIHAPGGGGSANGSPTAPGSRHAPRSTTRATGIAHDGAPETVRTVQSPSPSGAGQGSNQTAGASQGGESGAGSGGPVGSAAGAGSAGGTEASGSPEQGSTEGGASGGGQSGAGSGSGGSEGSSSGGSSGGSGDSESSGGEQSGSLVGTVVHEVGSVLEHLLH
jgi:RNA polymerase sigma factor (sigma-70 family)